MTMATKKEVCAEHLAAWLKVRGNKKKRGELSRMLAQATGMHPRSVGRAIKNPAPWGGVLDLVQQQVKSQVIRVEDKEFAFTKLMVCGLCGSGISADEKFKKQKNGNVHRYVYYGCTKSRDKSCKCGYIKEEELIEQFTALMDKVDLDEIGIKNRLKAEVERFKKFQQSVLEIRSKVDAADLDIRNYAKYLLREGTSTEKRELLGCFKSKLLLRNKSITLEPCH
jgi:hypothetical protein